MKNILYISTISDTINAFLTQHIKALIEEGNSVDCAANFVEKWNEELINMGIDFYDITFSRNPLHIKNFIAFRKLINIQQQNNYDIVHVHTPVASIFGRLLKLKFPKLKTIYTVHGFHFYNGAPFKNWLIYYPIEKMMAKLTDCIITINSEDFDRASSFNVDYIYKFDGVGIDLKIYNNRKYDSKAARKKLNLEDDDFVMLMIAEVNKNKNHKQIIEAIDILKKRNIHVKLLCAGDGPLFNSLENEIRCRNLDKNIKMLGYRNDINELISACDIGIMMSYREGLPRSIMEFMAHKKTVIGTDTRGIRDLIENNENGLLVSLNNSEETADAIERLYYDRTLLKNMSDNSFEYIKKYDVDNIIDKLVNIY